jgi:hypothetical protein
VVALFNWGDAPQDIGFTMAELGEDQNAAYALYEFWTATSQGVHTGRFAMPVPPRSVRLLAMHRAAAHPQFLSSDRHITQGGVEVRRCAWNETERALEGAVQVIGGFPLTLRFRVSEGFVLSAATADDKPCETRTDGREILLVTLSSDVTADVSFRLSF